MGTRASRLPEDPSPFIKDGSKSESFRHPRFLVNFSGSFDYAETNQSRSEEGSDSDTVQQAKADGSPSDQINTIPLSDITQTSPAGDKSEDHSNNSPQAAANTDHKPVDGTDRVPHRTFSERLPGIRQSSVRNVTTRSTRVRGSNQRAVSEAWICPNRVNRHGNIRCPFCSKPFPGSRMEDHLSSCLTSPLLPYNTDLLCKDSGECSICLDDLLQGETIARLACLCVYHKSCIDSWSKVKPCCPEHPFD